MINHLDKRCEYCSIPIPYRSYQDNTSVRCCSPGCAGKVYHRENPTWGSVLEFEPEKGGES
jgi:hypothetical protein